jgi:hypothetical protein
VEEGAEEPKQSKLFVLKLPSLTAVHGRTLLSNIPGEPVLQDSRCVLCTRVFGNMLYISEVTVSKSVGQH